jgi:hypothetical protein
MLSFDYFRLILGCEQVLGHKMASALNWTYRNALLASSCDKLLKIQFLKTKPKKEPR